MKPWRAFPVVLFGLPVALVSAPAQAAARGADLCNLATVKPQSGNAQIVVLSRPATKAVQVAMLPAGATIYVCDETRGWYQIFFGDPSGPCASAHPNGLPRAQATSCRSGWAVREAIEILSG